MKREPPPSASAKVNLRLLEVFAAVAEEGTMSAAAQHLDISQAAVSQSITLLEDALGVQLFDRSVRPPALTLVGKSALKCSMEVFSKLHELQDTVRHVTSGRVPLLRIGMLDSFTSTAGAPLLQHLKDLAAEWTVTSGFRATNFQALLERRSDVIITSDDSAVPDGVDVRPILTERFQLAAPIQYRGDVSSLKAIASKLDFIRYGRDAHMSAGIEAYLRRAGVHPARRYQFDTTDALLRMVASGFGWTIVTPLILMKSMASPKTVRVVPLPGPPLSRQLVVAMRQGESVDILERVHTAALQSLRETVLPRLRQLVPDIAESFSIPADDVPARRRRTSRAR